jgi:hypothetical protein
MFLAFPCDLGVLISAYSAVKSSKNDDYLCGASTSVQIGQPYALLEFAEDYATPAKSLARFGIDGADYSCVFPRPAG